MKIARIETFILGSGSSKDLLFCRVETEDGLFGWGEAYVTQGKEKVVAECVTAMAPHLIGRSAFNIRHTAQGDGLHCREIRSIPWPMAQFCRSPR